MGSPGTSWASSPSVRLRMQAQRPRDTGLEVRLRQELHARGLRFRLHRQLLPGLRRTSDIVFGPAKVVVDVRGCYWHGCPVHYRPSASNGAYWQVKIDRNRARDLDTERRLEADGWAVLVVWEHEDLNAAATVIGEAVLTRRESLDRNALTHD